eukprot:5438874-Prymnesium_polylepis.1
MAWEALARCDQGKVGCIACRWRRREARTNCQLIFAARPPDATRPDAPRAPDAPRTSDDADLSIPRHP